MDIKKQKLTHMRVHQAVSFEKGLVSFFSSQGGPNRAAAKMTILENLQAVLCEGPTDKVLVPMVNVAFIKLETEAEKKKQKEAEKEANKPKSTLKAQDIKRPR